MLRPREMVLRAVNEKKANAEDNWNRAKISLGEHHPDAKSREQHYRNWCATIAWLVARI